MPAITLSAKFRKAHLRILFLGLFFILGASLYSPYSYEEIMGMFLKDRWQLIVVHVLFNLLISVLLIFGTWQVNKKVLGEAFNKLGILNQLWFAMRFFLIYGLVSIFAPIAFWLYTVIG